MSVPAAMPPVKTGLCAEPVSSCEADFLIVPVVEDDDLRDVPDIDAGAANDISRALSAREFRAKPFEVYVTGFSGRAGRLLCIGAGPREKLTVERVRRVATAGASAACQRGGRRVAFLLRPVGRDASADATAAAEGLVLAAQGADRYKTKAREAAPLTEAVVVGDHRLAAAVERGAVVGRHTNLARWLSDEPGNVMTPARLAAEARACLEGTGVAVEVFDERQLQEQRMGLLLGVGRGSAEPPRLIVMRYTPPSGATTRVLGLVGKGVTFDTGGISLKQADGMEKMKHDMSGGAAVIAAVRAIASLSLPVSVLGVVPAVENMPGGRALKPGDILTSAEGKTVELINTDAEGRLILGDALWFTRQLGATHLVDVATLTGACVIALGKVNSGVFGFPDPWVAHVRDAGARMGERFWPLPVDDDYVDLLKSECADLANSGGRAGGAIAAAMFLREFTGGLPWAHLDIAGTAWADDPKPWQPKGATGVTVRTLVEVAASADGWPA